MTPLARPAVWWRPPAASARPSPPRGGCGRPRGAVSAEAMAALREERMLGAFVPRELGGLGATIGEVAASCEALGRSCASTAMIYAMHQIEVACLVRHAARLAVLPRLSRPARASRVAHRVGDIRARRRRRSAPQHLCRGAGRLAHPRHQTGARHLVRRGGRRHPADGASRARRRAGRPGARAGPQGRHASDSHERLGHARHARHAQPRLHTRSCQAPPSRSCPFRSPTSPARRCCRCRTCCGPRSGLVSPATPSAGRVAFVRAEARRTPGAVSAGRPATGRNRGRTGDDERDGPRRPGRLRAASGRSRSARRPGLRHPHEQPEGVGVADGAGDRRPGARRVRDQRLSLRLALLASGGTCATRMARR